MDKNLEPIGEPGTFSNLKLRALPTLVDGDAVVTESSTFLSSRLLVFHPFSLSGGSFLDEAGLQLELKRVSVSLGHKFSN